MSWGHSLSRQLVGPLGGWRDTCWALNPYVGDPSIGQRGPPWQPGRQNHTQRKKRFSGPNQDGQSPAEIWICVPRNLGVDFLCQTSLVRLLYLGGWGGSDEVAPKNLKVFSES